MRLTVNLMLILALVSTPVGAANISVPGDYASIQDAVDAASPGDRILVAAGAYTGASINKWVKISGVGDATVITNGPIFDERFHDAFRLFPGADKTEISDLRIEFSGSDDYQRVGIFAGSGDGPSAERVAVHGVTFVGLNRAVHIEDTSGWRITDNIIDGLRETLRGTLSVGIWLSGTGNCLVEHNTIHHNSPASDSKIYVGINLSASSSTGQTENNKVVNNTVSINATGALKFNDIELFTTMVDCDGLILSFDNKVINIHAENVLLTPSCLIDHNVVH